MAPCLPHNAVLFSARCQGRVFRVLRVHKINLAVSNFDHHTKKHGAARGGGSLGDRHRCRLLPHQSRQTRKTSSKGVKSVAKLGRLMGERTSSTDS